MLCREIKVDKEEEEEEERKGKGGKARLAFCTHFICNPELAENCVLLTLKSSSSTSGATNATTSL